MQIELPIIKLLLIPDFRSLNSNRQLEINASQRIQARALVVQGMDLE